MAGVALTPSLAELAPRAAGGAPLRLAVAGAGRQGRAVLQELQQIEGAEVVAVCDTDAGRLERATRRARGLRGYASVEELLDGESELEALVVATPTHAHRGPAEAALEAGLHVYCEAPLASTVEDSRALAARARASERVFAVGLLARANPIYALARSFHRSGTLRELVSLAARDHRKTSWRNPVSDPERQERLDWRLDPALSLGLAGELGTQQFDVFHWFLGLYPVSVRGSGSVRVHEDGREVADTAACELAFEDGLRLHWEASLGNSYEGRLEVLRGSMASFELAWTHGWMFKEAEAPTQGWEVYANRQTFHADQGITLIADATKLAAQGKLEEGVGLPHPPLHYALARFVAACAGEGEVHCGAEEGHRSTVVGLKASEAVTSGETVEIPPELLEVR